jgi:hypothetical protein
MRLTYKTHILCIGLFVMFYESLSFSHGVTPMDPTEPTYVGTTIFQDRKSYELWVSTNKKANIETKRVPETVYYEGTLVISSGTWLVYIFMCPLVCSTLKPILFSFYFE